MLPSFIEIGPPVTEKKIFLWFLPFNGGHLGHVTWIIYINFRTPFLRMLHMKFGFDWPSGFRGEDCGQTTDAYGRQTTDRRTSEHGHPISSPCEPSAQVS